MTWIHKAMLIQLKAYVKNQNYSIAPKYKTYWQYNFMKKKKVGQARAGDLFSI
jgi:hypothetical protein